MDGYLLLADGTRFDGVLAGGGTTALGWPAANTAVVGFQEMATDPSYRDAILAFTYPEVGNVGTTAAFSESGRVQAAGLVVKVLSEFRSHYSSEDSLENMLASAGVPCLTGVDTRALAVHLRNHGEMAAALAPCDADPEDVSAALREFKRPLFTAAEDSPAHGDGEGPKVAVLNLGIRRSEFEQLRSCCAPQVFAWNADAEAVLAAEPTGVFVSDGPGAAVPADETVRTVGRLLGRVPILACGLGHIALGVALGCRAAYLNRGHHGANYPVRNAVDGAVQLTQQRHSAVLDRDSVLADDQARLLWENVNDGSVEGICSADRSAVGVQFMSAGEPGLVSEHIQAFAGRLTGR